MILVELSKLLKSGKIDHSASRSSQFLQLVDAVFDEVAEQMEMETFNDEIRTDEEQLNDSAPKTLRDKYEAMVKQYLWEGAQIAL